MRSQPVSRVIETINPILRGWVHYFSLGHASRCFAFIRNWVEHSAGKHAVRRHAGQKAEGCGPVVSYASRLRLETVESAVVI